MQVQHEVARVAVIPSIKEITWCSAISTWYLFLTRHLAINLAGKFASRVIVLQSRLQGMRLARFCGPSTIPLQKLMNCLVALKEALSPFKTIPSLWPQ